MRNQILKGALVQAALFMFLGLQAQNLLYCISILQAIRIFSKFGPQMI